jgi:type IV pilus assembly protein PilM
MGLLVKDTEFFGLDIGSTAIRLVQLKRGGVHPALVAYGALPVPANLTSSDSKMDQDKISEMIKQLVRENRVSLKNVVVGLPSNKVFATVITTPKLDNSQLAKAIRYQAEQYIPMALDQVKLWRPMLRRWRGRWCPRTNWRWRWWTSERWIRIFRSCGTTRRG